MMSVVSCRENADRASLAQDGQLRLLGRVVLMLHLVMCPRCRAYVRQIRRLAALLYERLHRNKGFIGTPTALDADARARILSRLREQGQD